MTLIISKCYTKENTKGDDSRFIPARLPRAQPEQRAAQPNVDEQVLANVPRHGVQVLWREDGPDEEVRAHRRARAHDGDDGRRGKDGQQGDVLAEDAARAGPVPVDEQERRRRGPVERRGPVADKGEDADGGDVEVADAVVGAGEVDRGDGVGAAGGEKGRVLEEQRRGGDLGEREVARVDGAVDDVREQKDGNVGGARLRHGQQRKDFVEDACCCHCVSALRIWCESGLLTG